MKKPSSTDIFYTWWGFIIFLFVLWLPGQVFAQPSPLTPGEVVKLWLTVYPDNLDRAASMTTLKFRQGLLQQDWIAGQEPILRGLKMKYGQSRILHEDTRGNEARVIMRVKVSSWMWSGVKDELYSLVKGEGGLWFIDRVDEYVPNSNSMR